MLDRTLTYFKILRTFILNNNNCIVYLCRSHEENILLTCQFLKSALLNPCK